MELPTAAGFLTGQEKFSSQSPRDTASGKGMVTSSHEVASSAGRDILAGGGNAIEAAIAMTFCLGVTYPHFCGLGGDALMLVADSGGDVQSLSGIGQAAEHCPSFNGRIPVRGPLSMLTTAAGVDALGQAFELSSSRFAGKLSWASLLEPAISLAQDGFMVSESERFWLSFREGSREELRDIYRSRLFQDNVPPAGFVRRLPALAKSLAMLAENGPRDFYEGELGASIARGLKMVGSPLDAGDLRRTRARLEKPLQTPYRSGVLVAHQPPSQGLTTLELMGILDQFDLKSSPEGQAEYFHLLVEAVKLAFLDRDRFVADPDFVQVPVAALLDPGSLKKKAGLIDRYAARLWPHNFRTGDTVYIGAADAGGCAVSMLATVYYDWGSGVEIGNTGVIWHNRGASFCLDPHHPNFLQPGKRPFHTLNPGMYLQDRRPAILYGTQGADGQPQTMACILTRMIDYGMDPFTALSRPRFLLGKTFSDERDTLKIEEDVSAAVIQELAGKGHEVSRVAAQSPLMGHAGAIRIDSATGVMTGAHDPRSDGKALGL